MNNSLILECKTCGIEEEITEMPYDYYMQFYFIPNGIDEICGHCGNESMVPIEKKIIRRCKYCGVTYCEYCCIE